MAIGSLPSTATEIFQEGLRLPPLKLVDRGAMNMTLEKILRLNSRTPDAFPGDIHAQLAACNVAKRRLTELCERYRAAMLLKGLRELKIGRASCRERECEYV